ncbi:conserved hypothetical protein [Bosea sp. 62]|uniref:ATP-binding protein n=1 Tax=unclassified Bosea (in: a-proteobacteria) TaxID=2653178 RepID=UPI001259F47A|nr:MULTISPECIES: ATP-binding protein [unclassified Bosea (in: a-proteobacteria)]CAD5261066.1 conserved hypothetical protein [Bosea sp. 7B]CAD5271512.1 conserved hypothetical protein [Bosea sp. 21B]CAD5273664.1 conserved hypothetical protein [Bosea sp. 46]VVT56179.1 conserved hypothetical protein [Bosea sp. EC-HK365B]VXB63755.1 conserved hypothetical protein [Bosea sp. 62]
MAVELDHHAYIERILDRELRLTLVGVELGSARDDAMRELTNTAASLYDGRILRELIQNAYDGSGRDMARILVRLDLTVGDHGVLYVANSGQGFTTQDVDSIVNPAQSRKRPGNAIGHKGLGFRSVELVSADPQIFSMAIGGRIGASQFDGYCFGFASERHQRERLGLLTDSALIDQAVGKAHALQLPRPLRDQPLDVQAYAMEGFATLVRLPLRTARAAEQLGEECRALFDERAPLPLFLTRLAELTIESVTAQGIERRILQRRRRPARRLPNGGGVELSEIEVDERAYLLATRAVDRRRFQKAVERAIAEQHRVEKWRDWQGEPLISVAIPLSSDVGMGRYYAFLPMEAVTPFHGYVDAPFFPDPDRKDLSFANPLNDMLLDAVAELCIDTTKLFAAANEVRSDLVHAAVDAVAWSGWRERLLAVYGRRGEDLGAFPLPIMRLATSDARWSRFDEVFDWQDEQHKILKGVTLAKANDLPLLRRNMGRRRVEALRALAEDADYPLEPWPEKLAEWIPAIAADLARRRKATRQEWEDFYADLAALTDTLPHLKGAPIFRDEDGKLAPADGGAGGGRIYIHPDADIGGGKRRRLTDAKLFPPRSLLKDVRFADPGLTWPTRVTNALVAAGLASQFSLVHVLGNIGKLLGARPRARDLTSALTWAFGAWKNHRTAEVEAALRSAGLRVPTGSGVHAAANATYFSAAWRDTQGDLLSEYVAAAGPVSRLVANLEKSLLPPWDVWSARMGGTSADRIAFLRVAGVRDGLFPVKYTVVRLEAWQWAQLRRGELPAQQIEMTVGPYWRKALFDAPRLNYQSRPYTFTDSWFLPGQGFYDRFTPAARHSFARLVVRYLQDAPEAHFQAHLQRQGGNSDLVRWSTPLAAFLRQAPWLPLAGSDEFDGVAPNACWYAPRSELPRFVRRLDRTIRDQLDATPDLRQIMTARLGLQIWTNVDTADRRIVALGDIWRAGIPDAEHDSFRKAYREAWEHWLQRPEPKSLPGRLPLVVEVSGRLTTLPLDRTDPDRPTVYVGDGAWPVLEQLLTALGRAVLSAPPSQAEACATSLRRTLGGKVEVVRHDLLEVKVDGRTFSPASGGELLVGDDREWLVELAVLIAELGAPLTNRVTPRSRQLLMDGMRRTRLHFVGEVHVSVGGSEGALPEELDGILPAPDDENPAIIVRGPEQVDWQLMARISGALALALNRPSLIDHIRLVFYALEREASAKGLAFAMPDDSTLAAALGKPIARIREVLRSLRSTSARLLELLTPAVQAMHGSDMADRLRQSADRLLEEGDVLTLLIGGGLGAARAQNLIDLCREADSLNDLRRRLGLDLPTFNAVLTALGPPWRPLGFADRLAKAFGLRLEERRIELEQRVRDAWLDRFDAGESLADYRMQIMLPDIVMPQAWIATYDEANEGLIDSAIDAQMANLTKSDKPSVAIDRVRATNRALLNANLDFVRQRLRAWAGKDSVTRKLSTTWTSPAELIIRAAMGSGCLDFRLLDLQTLPKALAVGDLWPSGAATSLELEALGLSADDLEAERKQEQAALERAQRAKRSIVFGEVEVDGGAEAPLQAVAQAFGDAFDKSSFRARSGPAKLERFTPEARPPRDRKGGPGGRRGDDPTYLSEEQRTLLGFAGELAAYRYLQLTQRGFADEHWLSSMGRRYLGLPATQDDDGFDFRIPRSRGAVHFEVKAHTGDPGYVDLERSQITAAASMAGESGPQWRILYVTHVRLPALVTVYELPNPFSPSSAAFYREQQRHGSRLVIKRA